jgi:hypothetical protein
MILAQKFLKLREIFDEEEIYQHLYSVGFSSVSSRAVFVNLGEIATRQIPFL